MHLRERPLQLKLALAAAILAIVADAFALFSLREVLGTGWLFYAIISMFRYMIYLFLLALAFNGRAWVRYVFVFGVIFSVYAINGAGPETFGDPSVIAYLVFSVVAIVFWFTDACQSWYRNPLRVAT